VLHALSFRAEPEATQPTPIAAPLVASSPAPPTAPRAGRRRTQRRVQRLFLPGEIGPPRQPSAQEHARRLLTWLREYNLTDREVLADDLKRKLYPAMCAALEWKPRAWNAVAKPLRKLTGGRKPYAWVEDGEGVRHRLRVYRIPRSIRG
jgi:hypothetical protein